MKPIHAMLPGQRPSLILGPYLGVGLVLMLLSASLPAAYITDKLVAGLYEKPEVSDKPLKALTSGTPLEVISRKNGFVEVRTANGTVGWVEAQYLTDEKPSRTVLLDAQARLSQLQKRFDQLEKATAGEDGQGVASLQEQLVKAQGRAEQLDIQLKAAQLQQRDAQAEADRLQAQVDQVAKLLDIQPTPLPEATGDPASTPDAPGALGQAANESNAMPSTSGWLQSKLPWLLLGLGLLAGFAAGFAYMRYRVTRRFGSMMRF